MGGGSLRAVAKPASRCISARESPPPDTATAMCPPSCIQAVAKESSRLFCAGGLAQAGGRGERRVRGVRVFRLEETKRGAAFRFLAQRQERLGELEHSVGRARR